jgi:hypothetical protein
MSTDNQTMSKEEFDEMRKAVEDAFLAVYVLPIADLTTEEKEKHRVLLDAAYAAVIRLENTQFAKLTAKANKTLAALSGATAVLQNQLAGLTKAKETLQIVDGALNVLVSIAKVLT